MPPLLLLVDVPPCAGRARWDIAPASGRPAADPRCPARDLAARTDPHRRCRRAHQDGPRRDRPPLRSRVGPRGGLDTAPRIAVRNAHTTGDLLQVITEAQTGRPAHRLRPPATTAGRRRTAATPNAGQHGRRRRVAIGFGEPGAGEVCSVHPRSWTATASRCSGCGRTPCNSSSTWPSTGTAPRCGTSWRPCIRTPSSGGRLSVCPPGPPTSARTIRWAAGDPKIQAVINTGGHCGLNPDVLDVWRLLAHLKAASAATEPDARMPLLSSRAHGDPGRGPRLRLDRPPPRTAAAYRDPRPPRPRRPRDSRSGAGRDPHRSGCRPRPLRRGPRPPGHPCARGDRDTCPVDPDHSTFGAGDGDGEPAMAAG
jgi:hypothetical protein